MSRFIPFAKPMIEREEKEAVAAVLEDPILVHGPVAVEFEKRFADFTGSQFAVSVSSCTAGMHLVYFSLGFGAGDEVIVPAQTHVATAHAVELTGATPIFVDASLPSGNIDLTAIEQAITSKTKAIAVVHYLGIPVDMPRLMDIANKHGLVVVEDCALALGAQIDDQHVGLHGDVGVFSFYPVKHMTTAEGGMIITDNASLASKLKLVRAFGVDRSHGERVAPGTYDVPELGFNYRMSEIHAAIGVEQIKKLDRFLTRRKENHSALELFFESKDWCEVIRKDHTINCISSNYCLGLLLTPGVSCSRGDIISDLAERGIGTSVYYPSPVPRMKYYQQKYPQQARNHFQNATHLSDSMIALPVGPHVSENDVAMIGNTVVDVVERLL